MGQHGRPVDVEGDPTNTANIPKVLPRFGARMSNLYYAVWIGSEGKHKVHVPHLSGWAEVGRRWSGRLDTGFLGSIPIYLYTRRFGRSAAIVRIIVVRS